MQEKESTTGNQCGWEYSADPHYRLTATIETGNSHQYRSLVKDTYNNSNI